MMSVTVAWPRRLPGCPSPVVRGGGAVDAGLRVGGGVGIGGPGQGRVGADKSAVLIFQHFAVYVKSCLRRCTGVWGRASSGRTVRHRTALRPCTRWIRGILPCGHATPTVEEVRMAWVDSPGSATADGGAQSACTSIDMTRDDRSKRVVERTSALARHLCGIARATACT